MAFEQKPNSGALFRNDRKEKDSHPTHTGTALIDGKEYFISAWTKESKGGNRFFSLAFKPKQASEVRGGTKNPPAKTAADFDETPF
jgi:hypothetical protein